MKIERISDNQIRCTLNNSDLVSRNLNLIELAYGTEKAKTLFREMIQLASVEVGFDAEDTPLMVEAIPLPNESIVLIITKVEDPDELDTRFSKFSPSMRDRARELFSQFAGQLLEGAQDLLSSSEPEESWSGKDAKELDAPAENASGESTDETSDGHDAKQANDAPKKKPIPQTRCFFFESLDAVSDAAKALGEIYTGNSVLYKRPDSRQYYLVLTKANASDLDFSRSCNILSEYADIVGTDKAGVAYFREHYETLIASEAIQKLQLL